MHLQGRRRAGSSLAGRSQRPGGAHRAAEGTAECIAATVGPPGETLAGCWRRPAGILPHRRPPQWRGRGARFPSMRASAGEPGALRGVGG